MRKADSTVAVCACTVQLQPSLQTAAQYMQAAAAAAAAAHLGALSSLRHALLGGLGLSLQGARCSGRETEMRGRHYRVLRGQQSWITWGACMDAVLPTFLAAARPIHGRKGPIHPWTQLT